MATNQVRNISHWQEMKHLHSGGTRNKKILLDENGDLFYFKESYNNENGKFYKYEFYSEIIASYIGEMIGLEVLQYEIAIYNTQIGCLSKSMISNIDEELIEGGKYLKAFDNSFILEDEKPKEKYTYQLILDALNHFKLTNISQKKMIEMLLFDAIIGNSDRHQENWGYIAVNTSLSEAFRELTNITDGKETMLPKWATKLLRSSFFLKRLRSKEQKNEFEKTKLKLDRNLRFSPIYDSGCCLGREIEEERIIKMIQNDSQIDKYISKGMAEIHWEGVKLSHFEMLKKLFDMDKNLKERSKNIIEKFNINDLSNFILQIDINLPTEFNNWEISNYRKDFIVKLLTLRKEKILQIINE
jgi:hypothetical protein